MGSYVGDIPVEKESTWTSLNMQGQEGAPDLLSRYVCAAHLNSSITKLRSSFILVTLVHFSAFLLLCSPSNGLARQTPIAGRQDKVLLQIEAVSQNGACQNGMISNNHLIAKRFSFHTCQIGM